MTTGLLRRLNEPEVEAVLSHELSHVAHRDVVVMTVASFLGILAGLLTRMFLFAGLFGGFGGRGRRGGFGGQGGGGGQVALIELGVILFSAIIYAISFILIRTLSRYRELAADRSGAILIGAAGAVGPSPRQGERRDVPHPHPGPAGGRALQHVFFAPAIAPGASLSSLFATHPPLQKRLDQLAKLDAEMHRAAS